MNDIMFNSTSKSRTKKRRRYKSARSVKPTATHVPSHVPTQWTLLKMALLCFGGTILAVLMLSPVVVLEMNKQDDAAEQSPPSHVGLSSLVHESRQIRQNWRQFLAKEEQLLEQELPQFFHHMQRLPPQEQTVPPNQPDNLGRGVAGLPLDQTPALLGAERATLHDGGCDNIEGANDLVYWNSPQGLRDVHFTSPFAVNDGVERFLTFEPDPGGWNNIRMSMEILFVLAAATGRTLVLPPKAPFYLLGTGKQGARTFGNFFNLQEMHPAVKVMSMKDFVEQHGQELLGLDTKAELAHLLPLANVCTYNAKNEEEHCKLLFEPLRENGWQPPLEAAKDCLIFDDRVFRHGGDAGLPEETLEQVERFCGEKRKIHSFYNETWTKPRLLHWQAVELKTRLLNHFYTFVLFTDPIVDNWMKRFVRDYLHYNDEIYCAASKIVAKLRQESPYFSTLHVRRGDFQYKPVKLPAEELYDNTKEIWRPGEILYIATDEKNSSFFDPIAKHHPVRFLSDYWKDADLGKLDPTYLGMIDTIVAAQGRTFAGTWFSTFTGYICRMRGHLGYSGKTSWYSWLERKTRMHEWTFPAGNYNAREWPIGWVGIDGDEPVPENELDYFPDPNAKFDHDGNDKKAAAGLDGYETFVTKDGRTLPKLSLSDLKSDTGTVKKPMARGVAGRPLEQTPALKGGSRAHIECDGINVDSLAYWNDPQGDGDSRFKSPFRIKGDTKYISFSPDRGGWNNVRMSLENIILIAAVTGRTLVLPPEINLYLLAHDKKKKHRSFADFFPLFTEEFQKRVPIITMKEFLEREGGTGGRVPIPKEQQKAVLGASDYCENREKSSRSCFKIFEFLNAAGYHPQIRAQTSCIVFDKDVYEGKPISAEHQETVDSFCQKRKATFWNKTMDEPVLIHFHANEKQWRLLTHFYAMIRFTDPSIDNYYKRFIRDFLHYHDSIYCAAGKIVKALQVEGAARGFAVDESGAGGFSAIHGRYGDFQYKKVKLPAEELMKNTKDIWQPKEILYIATDNRNKTFFAPLTKHHEIRFLDDYWDLADLSSLDPNYMGMIDTIVASRARAFSGTWFSTFSGYINRMRGYHGLSMQLSYYSWLERKTRMHEWSNETYGLYAYEWPEGWIGIDADVWPSRDKF